MKTTSLTRNDVVLVETVYMAVRLPDRMRGLMGRKALGVGEGMYLAPCNSIHTFFMKFRLDLVFFDRTQRVTRIVRDVSPYTVVFGGRSAGAVLEMSAGWLPENALKPGDLAQLVETDG